MQYAAYSPCRSSVPAPQGLPWRSSVELILILVALVAGLAFFLSHLLGGYRETANTSPVGTLEGSGAFAVDVVGESRYQDALERICGGRTTQSAEKFVTATLVLEDENPHDSQAVRIDIEGSPVGYLARDLARQYRRRLVEAGHPSLIGRCDAVIRGGWRDARSQGSFGVKLDLPTG